MGTLIYLPLLLSLLLHPSLSAEKVLFGQPSPISAEARQTPAADAAKDVSAKDGRKGRVFTFPGSSQQQQDSRTHQPAYIIPSSPYETEDRFGGSSAGNGVTDENRLLSLLPTFGSDGMQVGLDFKLPFFSIPYAKMFSALSAPTIGGGFFGGSGASFPSPGTSGASFPGTSSISNVLSSNLLGSGTGSGLATAAAMAVTAALLYPKVSNIFSLGQTGVFRDGNGADDFLHNINSVLNQFNIDGESCMKVALCSLGNARQHQRVRGRDPSGSTTPADIVEDLMNLPAVKKMISKGGLTQARDFGGTGGDCEYFNAQQKCPVASKTFQSILTSLG